ncbi:MAG: hypothetical protein JKY09_06245 [Crocinitomicaceae bacterium]|nr:hypothetical protein [Crocinitomicaceae bacterium]
MIATYSITHPLAIITDDHFIFCTLLMTYMDYDFSPSPLVEDMFSGVGKHLIDNYVQNLSYF